jgi:hypothetical protein
MRLKNVKKLLSLLIGTIFCYAIMLSAVVPVFSAESATLSISSIEGNAGDTVQVDVSLLGVTSMAQGYVDIAYNPQIIKPLANGVTSGELVKGFLFDANPNYSSRIVRIAWLSTSAKSGSGKICSIRFQLFKSGQTSLEADKLDLKNSKSEPIPCSVVAGSVIVKGDSDLVSNVTSSNTSDIIPNITSNSTGSTIQGEIINPSLNLGRSTSIQASGGNPYPGLARIKEAASVLVLPTPSLAGVKVLNDIEQHWANNYIQRLAALGVISGYPDSTFKPDNIITRAEFAHILSMALKLPSGDTSSDFKDWSNTARWARPGIAAVVKAGIVKGYGDGTFQPEQPISRSEMVVMIIKSMKKEVSPDGVSTFSDNSRIPGWALPYVQQAVIEGIISGQDGNLFKPNDPATRAEVACILTRMLDKMQK